MSSCSHSLIHPQSTSGARQGLRGREQESKHQLSQSSWCSGRIFTSAREQCSHGGRDNLFWGPAEGGVGGYTLELGKDFKKTLLDQVYVKSQNCNVLSKPQDSILRIFFRHLFKDKGSDRFNDLSEAARPGRNGMRMPGASNSSWHWRGRTVEAGGGGQQRSGRWRAGRPPLGAVLLP